MPMPRLMISLLVVASVAVWAYVFGDSEGDEKPVDNSASSPRSACTTEPPDAFPPPASSSRSQTNVNTPATSHHNSDLYNRCHLPTRDRDSRQTSLASSTPNQLSYQQPSTPVRPVQTQASLVTPDDDLSAYYSSLASPRAEESCRADSGSCHSYSARQTSTHDGWAINQEDGGLSAVREDSLASLSPHDGWAIYQEDRGLSTVREDSLASPSPHDGWTIYQEDGGLSAVREDSLASPSPYDGWAIYQEDGGLSAVREDSLASPSTHDGWEIYQEGGGFSAVREDSLASPSTGGSLSRQTYPVSAPLSASSLRGSTRVRRTTVRTSTTTNGYVGIHRSGLPSPDAEESHLAHLSPSLRLSPRSYLPTPSPDSPSPDVFGFTESPSPQTHTRTLSSSSDSDYHGANPFLQVRIHVPGGLRDMESGTVINKQNMEMARDLREQARRSHREMQEARDEAKSARKRRNSKAERTYNGEARSHESKKKLLNKKAAKIIFTENNKPHKEGIVDLHGLYANEAVEYAKEEIQSAMYRNDETVCFITGKGSHADGGVSKLRPALMDLCDEFHLVYSLDPENAGRLIVYLN